MNEQNFEENDNKPDYEETTCQLCGWAENQRRIFNATSLLKQWNEQTGVTHRHLDKYFASSKTVEFIQTIMKRENLNTPKMVYLKSRGRNGGTYMHPILFIDFCMWINPSFKYDVLKFVYDKMLTYRNEAGDAYRELASAMNRICTPHQMKRYMPILGKGINYIITNKHDKQLRNEYGTEEKQKEYFELEKQVAMLINEDFLKTPEDVVNYLRRKFQQKYF